MLKGLATKSDDLRLIHKTYPMKGKNRFLTITQLTTTRDRINKCGNFLKKKALIGWRERGGEGEGDKVVAL